MNSAAPLSRCPFVVAFDQCGLELQGPHMVTTTKRLIPQSEIDAGALQRDSLRYHAWDPEAVRLSYRDLDRGARYEIEVVFACERPVRRVMAVVAGGIELAPAIALKPGGATVVRLEVPAEAIRAGALDVAIERREGPDAIVSEVKLWSSVPAPPMLTVVGDSRGGLIGTVGDAEYAGIAGAEVVLTAPGGELRATSDERGVFRLPLLEVLAAGQHAEIAITARTGGPVATQRVDTRTLARGLTELPEVEARLSLAGEWQFVAGRHPEPDARVWSGASAARVPGHVAFDGLVPERGVATLRRAIEIPDGWDGGAVFARFDGAYGRAEVFFNGRHAGTHSAGATSFDVELTPFLAAGGNVLTVVLTEYTPHAVLDYMSWYAHTSLLGIWREAYLFSVPRVHLGPTDLKVDWNPEDASGRIDFATQVVNLGQGAGPYTLELTVSDEGRVLHRTTLRGMVDAAGSTSRAATLNVPDVEPWSAEIPRLYDLEVELRSGDGRAAAYSRRVGFRRVEVRGRQLLVNGAPIRLLGVNRHDARMLTGRSMRTEDLRHDVEALRQANVNVIRTAHYPADPRLLAICDELGMYVDDQMPICFAAGFDDHAWTRTNEAAHLVPYVLEVTAETVRRDQPHASVILWDLANETHWGWGFDAQLEMVREMDTGRPTLFTFDLNQLGDTNPLPQMPAEGRPDLRTYHYPGWDRSWQEDIDWLRSYDQPAVLSECNPPFQDNARAPLHAELLAIDPGFRDFWVTGAKPFMARAMQDRGCIGGMIWSAVDDQWVLPLDESVGSGNWAHLTTLDYYRVRDVHPPQDGLVFRGEGEWGLLDGWGRPRPELWHIHKLYSPIEVVGAEFAGDRLELRIRNRHAHRSLEALELQLTGATLGGKAACLRVAAAPGGTVRVGVDVDAGAETVEAAFWHPEDWLVDAFSWAVPQRTADPQAAVRAAAEPARIELSAGGDPSVSGAQPWLAAWPRLHVQDANNPYGPTPLPGADKAGATVAADGTVSVPLTGNGWDGELTARAEGNAVVFTYDCRYSGEQAFNAHEIGLAFELPTELSDLWWHRVADWTAYPEGHIGRPRGYARSAPGPADPLRPAGRWEDDTTPAGSNDYRSAKRAILAAGATDGKTSVSVLSDGSQHVRASLIGGAPVLHVLDWYGGVPFRLDTDHIWTATFGTGRRIERGTRLQGRVTLVRGTLPTGVRP